MFVRSKVSITQLVHDHGIFIDSAINELDTDNVFLDWGDPPIADSAVMTAISVYGENSSKRCTSTWRRCFDKEYFDNGCKRPDFTTD